MKKINTKTKVLLTLLVTLLVIGAMTVVSFAAEKKAAYDNKYGQIVPTDSKLEAKKTSFTFYGDSANLYFMRISKGKENANYAVEIYSDKACTKLIRSMSGEYSSSKGNTPLAIAWNFKSTPGGTYYGKCYTYISRDDGDVIDTDSIETFKIKIDRLSKKTVSLKSVKNTTEGVKISWSTLPTATKYKVMRKADGEKKWKTIQTLGKGSYTFTDASVKSGKKYTYTVRAYDGNYDSLYNKKGLSITYLATPKLVDVAGTTSSGYAKIKWKAVSGAKSYEIYRKGGSLNNSEWKKIATVKGKNTVTYVDKKATKTDWYYSYSVRAVNGSNKSVYNTDGLDFDYMRAPKLKKAYSYTNGARITWSDASDVAEKYYVYRKTSSGWNKVGSTTKKYFTDKTAKSGKTYTYTVKAVSDNNGGAYNIKGIKVNYLAMPKLGEVTFDSSNRAKVTWSTVSGATSYKVFRKINSAKDWTEIATVKGGTKKSYLDKVSKKSGDTYQYSIRAISKDATSYYDKTGIKNMFLSNPSAKLSNVTAENGKVNVKLSWSAIKGAKTYNIYRRAPGESDFKCIASKVTSTTYYDTAVKNNVQYRYAVRAINGSAKSRYNSVYIVALNRPVMESVKVTESGVALNWTAIEGADAYYIYRKAVGGKWEIISSYSLNAFVDTSKDATAKPFYYSVSAESNGYKSDYDTVGMKNFVEATELNVQFNPATETELPNIMINWSFDEGVESVELFKSIGDDTVSMGIYTSDMGITEKKDEDIAIGTEYTYTIKPIKAGKLSVEKSASAKYPHAPLETVEFELAPTYSDEGSFVNVTFAPVEFAENYVVYRKTSADAEWGKIGTVSAEEITEDVFTFTDNDIDEETIYYYTVKAIASDRDSLFNEYGKTTVVYTPVEPVAGIIAKEETIEDRTVAVITWDAAQYAEVYKVLRKTADSEWEILGEISAESELKFVDETIEEGIEYIYTILSAAQNRGEAINEIGAEFCWGTPIVPEEPTNPEEPKDPDDSEDLIVPENPDVPTVPDFPEIEGVPDEPVIPEEIPDGPTANPDTPTEPENPDDSENIEVPENPDVPTVPDIPEIEDVPDEPSEGGEVLDGPEAIG
ncbi:MAG: hypothetical protein UGF89_08600 [Acutalibacteraceae bacterium]|nr:hypothetical protein [Acutalibacteraceae bacterium]